MALSTFDSLYKGLLLRCPSASLFLARSWIDFAYRQLWDIRRWSWLVGRGQFLFSAVVNNGLVTVTRGSLTVQGIGTTFTTDLVNRQFRIGLSTPIYTIAEVDDTLQTLTLDQVWGAATATSVNYQIYTVYVTPSTDFQSFISVWDPAFNWSLALYVTQEELNAWDSQRSNNGNAYCIASYKYDEGINSPPLPMFEAWPHIQQEYVLPYIFIRRPLDLSDPGAQLPRYIRGDVLLELGLAQAARWPGPSKDAPNVYFNLALAQQHDARAQKMIFDLERQDDEIFESDMLVASVSQMPIATFPLGDSRWLQSHA